MSKTTDQDGEGASNRKIIFKPHHYITAWIIWLLTVAINVRKAGLIVLLIAFLINCYFILFDQQSYIEFLENFSSDGNISDNIYVFIRIQTFILISFLLLTLIDQSGIDSLNACPKINQQVSLYWRQRKPPYIFVCTIWLLISYLPFIVLNRKTINMMAAEDSFYEYSGSLWLLLTSISFIYLFFRKEKGYKRPGVTKKRNIFFLLLGLLFLFGAGEEVSWGQRIFHYKTPEVINTNLQHEFNLHNMPWFDLRASINQTENGRIGITKKGWALALSIPYLFSYFSISYCFLLPLFCSISSKTKKWIHHICLPLPPIVFGIFLLVNSFIYSSILQQIVSYPVEWPMTEIREAADCFFLFVLSLWFIYAPNHYTTAPQND